MAISPVPDPSIRALRFHEPGSPIELAKTVDEWKATSTRDGKKKETDRQGCQIQSTARGRLPR